MKFTYNWLKEYVDVDLKPQELAQRLTMAGLEVESLQQLDGDWLFEAEITTNRPDWLSIIGIARETAAITGAKLKLGDRFIGMPIQEHKPVPAELSIEIKDKPACPRYTGRIISDVKVGPSPDWLKRRIQSIGLRPINNIVDITNFVLFETGQPLHAFDFDKLKGAKIIVRRAKDGEDFITIDGAKHILKPGMLVIADEERPVAIAGIMGGRDTEVTEATKNILLESAYFDPGTIRRASKFLALSSDSSYRFERNVDYSAVKAAQDRAGALILKVAGGKAGKLVDAGKKPPSPLGVSLRTDRLNGLLGIRVPHKDIIDILTSLGLGLKGKNRSKLSFSIPSWRRDLKKETDLIEEVIRIYGYDKIPAAQPKDMAAAERVFMPPRLEFQALVRDALISFGLNEILAYSLTSQNIDEDFYYNCEENEPLPFNKRIRIGNPLSPDLAYLRTNLTAGLLLAARWNLNRSTNDIKLFEIGPVYFADGLDRPEENHLGICLSGNRAENWQDGPRPADFYYLKGVIEGLFAKLGIEDYRIAPSGNRILEQPEAAQIMVNNKAIGFLGKARPDLLAKIDIGRDCFICQISMEELFKHKKTEKKFSSLPKFPSVYRDISTLTGEQTPCAKIVGLIEQTGAGLVKDVKLFDVYRGEQIPKGHKSLVYRLTYQSPDKTLTDKEVDAVHSKILLALKSSLGVQIR